MARLIINNDTIQFTGEGKNFTGRIARLVTNDEIIFIIKYLHPDVNNPEIRRVKRKFCETASRFHWVNHPVNEADYLSQAIGEEIEKFPDLLVLS
jgi:hypothetical protein